MDLNNTRPIILSCGNGQWFAKGVERLERSLNFVGSPIPWHTWKNEYPPNSPSHEQFPYAFKISAIDWAIEAGYTHILWVDASFWAVKSPMTIFDIIDEQGFYCFRTGYNLGQTISDSVLATLRLTRDQVADANEWAGGFLGFRMDNPDGARLYRLWKSYVESGLSKGSRNHDGQSSDPRFLHFRQDQSCFSLAMYQLGLTNKYSTEAVAYWPQHNPEEVIFFLQGI
jgi:hypothetical protein